MGEKQTGVCCSFTNFVLFQHSHLYCVAEYIIITFIIKVLLPHVTLYFSLVLPPLCFYMSDLCVITPS